MLTSAMHDVVLDVRDLEVGYGKHQILRGVSFDVRRSEAVALLGANGVGKTTLLNAISGFLKPSAGSISLEGENILSLGPHGTFRRGVVQVSQSRDLFPDMSVEDNLRLGAANVIAAFDLEAELERVYASFPRLKERRTQQARTLSGGEQQMVAIGRAVMGRPKILLLDEPSGGLAPQFVMEIGNIAVTLKAQGTTMLLVEQNIALALRVADRCLVIRDGRISGAIPPEAIQGGYDEVVRQIYL